MSTILDSLKKSSNSRGDNDKSSIDNFSFTDNSHVSQSKFPVFLILLLLTLVILYFGYLYLFSDTTDNQMQSSDNNPAPVEISEQDYSKSKSFVDNNPTNKIEKPNSKEVKKILQKEKDNNRQVVQINSTQKKKINLKEQSFQNLNKPLSNRFGGIENIYDPAINLKSTDVKKQSETKEIKSTIQHFQLAYQLPFIIRKDLPELILNIHVYDENANNRIAIINGEKFEVGTLIGDEVLVKEIVLEGVVLEFKNTIFLLPKL